MPDNEGSIQILTDEQLTHNLEVILDKIADAMILNIDKYPGENPAAALADNQKTIRNGIIRTISGGLSSADVLVLYQKEAKANPKDAPKYETGIQSLTSIIDSWGDITLGGIGVTILSAAEAGEYTVMLTGTPGGSHDITQFIVVDNVNPPNFSQFIGLGAQQQNIDPAQADEYLNTNIYELLPTRRTRQQRIDDFYREYQALKGQPPSWEVDPITSDLTAPEDYEENHDISSAQDDIDAIIPEENSFITRLNIDANTTNSAKTLQSLRDDLNRFLEDIDQEFGYGFEDGRPEYENKSEGYLKIRNLNQGMIIRKQEGDDIGLEQLISIAADETDNNTDFNHPHIAMTGPSYLMDGFTVTIWVKFLDKTSTGTLFNYGNPTRNLDPKGFKLETFVLNRDDTLMTDESVTWGEVAEELRPDTFGENNYARFVRLVVYDHIKDQEDNLRKLYDSRQGISTDLIRDDNSVPEFGYTGAQHWDKGDEKNLLGHIQIPVDFNEWYFIVASYNPMVYDNVGVDNEYLSNPYYWLGNINPSSAEGESSYTHYSGYGSKCKVEVISRSDLLRARGYKV